MSSTEQPTQPTTPAHPHGNDDAECSQPPLNCGSWAALSSSLTELCHADSPQGPILLSLTHPVVEHSEPAPGLINALLRRSVAPSPQNPGLVLSFFSTDDSPGHASATARIDVPWLDNHDHLLLSQSHRDQLAARGFQRNHDVYSWHSTDPQAVGPMAVALLVEVFRVSHPADLQIFSAGD